MGLIADAAAAGAAAAADRDKAPSRAYNNKSHWQGSLDVVACVVL